MGTAAPLLTALPPSRLRVLEALFDQQLWCWGCDIRAADNYLLRFGFSRWRSDLAGGPSCYELQTAHGQRMLAFGFGIVLQSDCDHWFVRRHPFALEALVSAEGCRSWTTPPKRHRKAATLTPLGWLAERLAEYEAWLATVAPPRWRTDCIAQRPRDVRRRLKAIGPDLAIHWRELAEELGASADRERSSS